MTASMEDTRTDTKDMNIKGRCYLKTRLWFMWRYQLHPLPLPHVHFIFKVERWLAVTQAHYQRQRQRQRI